jgi:hypothetical protein
LDGQGQFAKRSGVISDKAERREYFAPLSDLEPPIPLAVFCLPKEVREVTLRQRVVTVLLLIGTTSAGLAQTRGGAVTIRTTTIGPIIALLAGILILLVPRVLNYVVAVYLILIGLIGLFGV